jgi:hypothetical protein
MFYIHQTTCISPQQSFGIVNLDLPANPTENKFLAIEPSYNGIPTGILRRMGKAVRMGVGAALPIISNNPESIDGIIIGTANGGMEDCIKFLNQIIDYDEGQLTPTNFVQSTPNAIAAQLGLLSNNKGYNITHVHRGLSFENAMLDVVMMLNEYPGNNYLLGGVDEISSYNFNIEWLGGWYKKEPVSVNQFYQTNITGSVAGEGAAMFLVNAIKPGALAAVKDLQILHTKDENIVVSRLQSFIDENILPGETVDLLLTGENGDSRFAKYYGAAEKVVGKSIPVARFKHMTGEYTSASAIAVWLACHIISTQSIPAHMLKSAAKPPTYKHILIYNNYKGLQHSFILINNNG